VPWLHEAFENVAAAASGAEAAYKALKRFGEIPEDKQIKFIALLVTVALMTLVCRPYLEPWKEVTASFMFF